MARRNITRILGLSPHKGKICLFSFQAIQSYLAILGMITIGFLLRHSSVALEFLAIVSALMYASIPYWTGKSAPGRGSYGGSNPSFHGKNANNE